MFFEKIPQWMQSIAHTTQQVKEVVSPVARLILSTVIKGAKALFPKVKSMVIDIVAGSTRYFSTSSIKTLQNKEAQDLRRVFKSSLKYNFLSFGIAFTFQNILKFLLLRSLLRLPGLKIIFEYTIEPVFETTRILYFGFTNFVYSKVAHKVVVKNNLVHQKSLESQERTSFTLLRESRSLAFYIVSSVLGKALYPINPIFAFLVEAYFLGQVLIDFKLSHAAISIERGIEISGVNNSHYLGVGLSYKCLVEFERFLMQRYLNLPYNYFDGPLSQLYIFLIHKQDLPLQDPLKNYQCYFVSKLPKVPPGNGLYLVPTAGVFIVKDLSIEEDKEDFVVIEDHSNHQTDEDEVTDHGFLPIKGNYYKIYIANHGKWVLDEEQNNRMIEVHANKIPTQIQEYYDETSNTQLSQPHRATKTFENFIIINATIEQYFSRMGEPLVRRNTQKWYITYPVQMLADWFLKNSVKAIFLQFQDQKRSKKDSTQTDLFAIVSEKVALAYSSPITTKSLKFLKEMECIALFIEFFKEDLRILVRYIEEYRYLIKIATHAIRRAGDITKDVEKITEVVINSFDQIKDSLSKVSSPIVSEGSLNGSLLDILKRFDEMSSYLSIPRWIIIKIFLIFLPAASIIESFQNVSKKFGEFFDFPPEVALKILMDGVKLLHRYKIPDLLDTLLEEERYNQIKDILKEEQILEPLTEVSTTPKNVQYAFFRYLASLEERIYVNFGMAVTLSQEVYKVILDLIKQSGISTLTPNYFKKSLDEDSSVKRIVEYLKDFNPKLATDQLKSILIDITSGIYHYVQRRWIPDTTPLIADFDQATSSFSQTLIASTPIPTTDFSTSPPSYLPLNMVHRRLHTQQHVSVDNSSISSPLKDKLKGSLRENF